MSLMFFSDETTTFMIDRGTKCQGTNSGEQGLNDNITLTNTGQSFYLMTRLENLTVCKEKLESQIRGDLTKL